jgi:hypothetical protein
VKKILALLLLSLGILMAQAKTLAIEVHSDQLKDAMTLVRKIKDKNSKVSIVMLDNGRVQILIKTPKK